MVFLLLVVVVLVGGTCFVIRTNRDIGASHLPGVCAPFIVLQTNKILRFQNQVEARRKEEELKSPIITYFFVRQVEGFEVGRLLDCLVRWIH